MNKEIISKELLSEILPFAGINSELISYGLNADGDILLQYDDIDEIVNIYELAHKCKEWACKKRGFVISCNISRVDNYDWILDIEHLDFTIEIPEILDNYTFNTEPEAIFKACQWILEQKHNIED